MFEARGSQDLPVALATVQLAVGGGAERGGPTGMADQGGQGEGVVGTGLDLHELRQQRCGDALLVEAAGRQDRGRIDGEGAPRIEGHRGLQPSCHGPLHRDRPARGLAGELDLGLEVLGR